MPIYMALVKLWGVGTYFAVLLRTVDAAVHIFELLARVWARYVSWP